MKPEARFVFTHSLPPNYRGLLWQTFFEERARGISLLDHFPQMAASCASLSYGLLESGAEILGGVTIRALTAGADVMTQGAGAIGLVCVAVAHRGRGLSAHLMRLVIDELASRGVQALTLWTRKPAVYQPLGFEPADTTLSGWVSGLRGQPKPDTAVTVERWPDAAEEEAKGRGLPPFALGAQRIRCSDFDTSAVIVCDPFGLAVAEWTGPERAVVEMLARLMPPRWRLHTLADDPLVAALEAQGATVTLEPNALQMWRTTAGSPATWAARYPLRILDRI